MSKRTNTRQIGTDYEVLAADYLVSKGYRIRERNFRCHFGEIDLIAQDGDTIVFVEVKYRKSVSAGGALPQVGYRKQHIISRVAMFYLLSRGLVDKVPCRFDVIGITGEKLEHVVNAFAYC